MAHRSPHIKRYLQNTSGNINTIFVILAAPILVAAGGAMDYATAVSMKTKMQNALDAATTAVCSDSSQDPDAVIRSRLSESISEFGLQLLPPPAQGEPAPTPTGNQSIVLNTTFDQTTGTVKPSLTTNMPTTLLNMVDLNEIEIKVETQVSCGAKRLELSLMLDVTGSMGWRINGKTKLSSMKTAANDVFDIFQRNMQDGSTRIALVPFSEAVNVGSYADAVRGTPSSGSCWTPGCSKYKFYDKWGYYRKWSIRNCVSERTGADAYTDAPPSSSPVGPVYKSSSCRPRTAEIVPLTNDEAKLRAEIASYSASGGTAGHLGTAWAWYMLSEKWAYLWPTANQPENPNPDELIKATILMTDGEYNEEYKNGVDDDYLSWSNQAPNGSSKSQAAKLCTAMKNSGVVVYAVGFGLNPNSSTAQRLKACASDDSKWFFPYNGEQLRAAFQSIGRSLAAGQTGQAIVKQ